MRSHADMKRDIERFILGRKDPKQREFLRRFMENHVNEGDVVRLVNEDENAYEFIVSHPGEKGWTGGAEQYFLDKKTGDVTMGWHEHPMQVPEIVVEPPDRGKPTN